MKSCFFFIPSLKPIFSYVAEHAEYAFIVLSAFTKGTILIQFFLNPFQDGLQKLTEVLLESQIR